MLWWKDCAIQNSMKERPLNWLESAKLNGNTLNNKTLSYIVNKPHIKNHYNNGKIDDSFY